MNKKTICVILLLLTCFFTSCLASTKETIYSVDLHHRAKKSPQSFKLDTMKSDMIEPIETEYVTTETINNIAETEEPTISLSPYIISKEEYTPTEVVEIRIYSYFAKTETDLPEELNSKDIWEFFNDIAQYSDILSSNGIPVGAVLAQAYTEGGAGRFGVYSKTNNLFGITAYYNWNGAVYGKQTKKLYDSYHDAVRDGNKVGFKVYNNIEDCITDYANIITTNDRYTNALNQPYDTYLHELIENGYGESHMADVWITIYNIYHLESFE